MSLIYITGISGSGKSTICKELKRRGYEAHDADGEGFNKWCDKETGKIAGEYDRNKVDPKEWDKKYSWNTSRIEVEKLAKSAINKLAFLCGVSANEEAVWDLFTKVICLSIDEATLRNRITTRTTNEFGKEPYEFEIVLEWYKTYSGDYLKKGALLVDANRPLNQVVDEILKIVFDESYMDKKGPDL